MVAPHHIKKAFDQRDEHYNKVTNDILRALEPTVLTALYTLFEVSSEHIHWAEVSLVDEVLVLGAVISYDPSQVTDEIAATIGMQDRDTIGGLEEVQRFVQVGIPLSEVHQSADLLVEFLKNVEREEVDGTPDISTPLSASPQQVPESAAPQQMSLSFQDFDTSKLTPEQLKQLKLTRAMKGVAH